MKKQGFIGNVINFWIRAERRYNKIKDDEQRRPKSIALGVRAICLSLLALVFIALSVWGIVACSHSIADGSGSTFLSIIGIVILIVIIISLLLNGHVEAMFYVIYQLKLNKRPIGWVALGILIFSVLLNIASTIAIIVMLK